MFNLGYSEFYITNVCNLNCNQCNRFNNYAFKNHYLWEDYKDIYAEWAKLIHIERIGILGGEPLGNPDFLNWMHGIANLWPNSDLTIVTNATYLEQLPYDLYSEMKKHAGRIQLEWCDHMPDTWNEIPAKVEKFLDTIVEVKDVGNDRDWFYTDVNGVVVQTTKDWEFKEPTLIRNSQTNEFTVHNNMAQRAWIACDFKKCHHFIEGKLYKCGPIGILPIFMKQYKVTLSENQRNLIESYRPGEHTDSITDLSKFLTTFDHAIPQCSICPVNTTKRRFTASTKKIKIHSE